MTNQEKIMKLTELKYQIKMLKEEKDKQKRTSRLYATASAVSLLAVPIVANMQIPNPFAQVILTDGLLVSGVLALANYLDLPNTEDRIDYRINSNKMEMARIIK